MSAEMKKLGQDLIDRGFNKAGKKLIHQAGVLEAAGEIPAVLNKPESRVDPINPLTQVIKEFNTQPHTPESYTATFQAIWKVRIDHLLQQGAFFRLEVDPCPYTQDELDSLEAEGRRLGYLPTFLSTQETRYLMGDLWPQIGSPAVRQENSITNEVSRHGWFDYEAMIDAPYRNTKEKDLQKEAERQGREGMSLSEYFVASQDSKLFTGKYLDQYVTRVRLLGSRSGSSVVDARFGLHGSLFVGSNLKPQNHAENLGGRLVGAPKAA